MSSPRNTFLAHLLGGSLGLLIFRVFQALGFIDPSIFGLGKVFSAALVLGTFGFLMVRLRILHPPAASTALIAATGYLPHWYHLLVLALATAILLLQAQVLHRLAGLRYPWWTPLEEEEPEIFNHLGRFRLRGSPPKDLEQLADQIILHGRARK
jgi:hypothetical protein